jgi:hypothetical protein
MGRLGAMSSCRQIVLRGADRVVPISVTAPFPVRRSRISSATPGLTERLSKHICGSRSLEPRALRAWDEPLAAGSALAPLSPVARSSPGSSSRA